MLVGLKVSCGLEGTGMAATWSVSRVQMMHGQLCVSVRAIVQSNFC